MHSIQSLDPRVRALAHRRARLHGLIEALDSMLGVYASVALPDREAAPVVDALRHYPMSDRAICGCGTCSEWRSRREELTDAMRFVPAGHKWSVCACARCRFVGRIQLNFVAASNVRDLLIEMSFHANFHSRHGGLVMAWLESEMRKPKYTVDWCAYELGRRPVDEFLGLAEKALSPVVSGIVFAPCDGESDAPYGGMSSQIGGVCASLSMEVA